VAGKFFERLDRVRVLSWVTRAGADVGEAERLQELADRALVIGDPKAIEDDALQVDPAPAHHAVHDPVRAGLDEFGDLGALLCREACSGPLDQPSSRPSGPCALNRCTQSRSVCRSMPPIRAACVRFMPSTTAASDRSRRLWFAFLVAAAKRRSSAAE
jgi:hypothetical protein